MKTLPTSLGEFELGVGIDPRFERVSVALKPRRKDQVELGWVEQWVSDPGDVVRLIEPLGFSKKEGRGLALRVWAEVRGEVLGRLNGWIVRTSNQPWPDEFDIVNHWTTGREQRLRRFFAGSIRGDQTGVVILAEASLGARALFPADWNIIEVVAEASKTGALKIASATDVAMTLTSARAGAFLLNLHTLALHHLDD